jgi:outer membrane protein TolC
MVPMSVVAPRLCGLALFAAALVPLTARGQAAPVPAVPAADSLTLQRAIDRAQEYGLAAHSARSARDAARQRDRAFDARFLPHLELTGNALNLDRGLNPLRLPSGETQFVRQSENQSRFALGIAQPLPWTGGTVSVSSQLTRVDQFDDHNRYWQTAPFVLEIRQGLFKPRTLVWDRREQDVNAEIAERQYLEAREDVAVATANAFFDVYAAQMALDNATSNAAVNDTLFTLNKGRYEVGKIGENDLLQSELALLRARSSLDGARLELSRTEAALRRLLNLPTDAPVSVVPPAPPAPIAADPAVAAAQALSNASAVQANELQRVRAERSVSQARFDNGFSADVTASVGFNQTASDFGGAYQAPQAKQQLLMAVEMPLVQWGAGRAAVAAARAEQERVASSTRAARLELEENARFAALQLAQTQRVLLIAAKADTVASKRFEVAKNRYVIGKIGISDLYIAQTEKDNALQEYVRAQRAYWAAYYRLRRLTLYDFAAGRPLSER